MFRSVFGRAVLFVCLTVAGTTAIDAQQQAQPRDPRPNAPGPATAREQQLQAATTADPARLANWIELARLQEERRAVAEAERTLKTALDKIGPSRELLASLAGLFNRTGRFELTVATLEQAALETPTDAAGYQLVATYYFDKAYRDASLPAADKLRYIDAGLTATDRALAINRDHTDALTYKNLLLRLKSTMETDDGRRQALIAEADVLRNRAMELVKLRNTAPASSSGAPAPLPPPPPPGFDTYDGPQPIRVGGNVKTPAKIRDVRPVYPQEAQDARISGMVILEAIIDPEGYVKTARVLRSVPALDQAAIDAVRQWQFVPTLLNGAAVPVIMTVTVNFTLQ